LSASPSAEAKWLSMGVLMAGVVTTFFWGELTCAALK
jgi:hypothetical protein